MATFADFSTFFFRLLEEFSLSPSTAQGAFLSIDTPEKKEKMIILPNELCKEIQVSPQQLMGRINRLHSQYSGIQREGWSFTYQDSSSESDPSLSAQPSF